MKAKCNQTIKLFLTENNYLKDFVTCALACKAIKDKRKPESELFKKTDGSPGDAAARTEFIDLVLKYVEDWKNTLGRDSKGKYTYFMMIHKSVFLPDEVKVNLDGKSISETFVPSEKDPLIIGYAEFSKDYQGSIDRLAKYTTLKDAEKKKTEENAKKCIERGTEIHRCLREVESKIDEVTRT